ncbi:MAG: signal peptide peptidase SppA [Burkholderiales bacterium]|nr:signal peptide peptidase SppA [Burkholderiales bacterium]
MASPVFSFLGRTLRGLWWFLDASRRALLNLLLLLLLVGVAWALVRNAPHPLAARTTLVVDLTGRITEQADGVRAGALQQLGGQSPEPMRLRDVVGALDLARQEPQVTQAVLMLDGFQGAGLPTLREVALAIDRFKAAGKPVYAWGAGYDQRQYYLAAHATQVWLDPMGQVGLQGYGGWRTYYKDLLDRLGLSANVIRAGKFKDYFENYTANGPSAETQQADQALYGGLWSDWLAAVETARKLPPGSIMRGIDSLPDSLQASGGDLARWALDHHDVDALKTRQQMRAALIATGARDEAGKTFRQVPIADFVARLRPRTDGDAVAVIVAEGEIDDGTDGPGAIGGLSTAAMIRSAREDDRVKAIVLRVNSPGGSAYGAELVRRELALARRAGKPVVVSMGDVAASGGYWIATAADEVIADPATITGSIGVITVLPTGEAGLAKLGVHTGGWTSTWLAAGYDPRRGLDPRYAQLVQAGVDHDYAEFLAHVAQARKATPAQIDAVAQGRVWTGADALARGLVDKLGGFDDALRAARARGKLPPDARVVYIEAEPSRVQQLLQRLGLGGVMGLLGELAPGTAAAPAWQAALQGLGALQGTAPLDPQALHDLGWLAAQAGRHRPYANLVHCLCRVP